MSLTLKPCPFCGCDRVTIVSNGIGDYFAMCGEEDSGCGASSSPVLCESEKLAAERWNRRRHFVTGTPGAGKSKQAYLIAAAPEMLSALRDLVALHPHGPASDRARRVIRKAEGKGAGS